MQKINLSWDGIAGVYWREEFLRGAFVSSVEIERRRFDGSHGCAKTNPRPQPSAPTAPCPEPLQLPKSFLLRPQDARTNIETHKIKINPNNHVACSHPWRRPMEADNFYLQKPGHFYFAWTGASPRLTFPHSRGGVPASRVPVLVGAEPRFPQLSRRVTDAWIAGGREPSGAAPTPGNSRSVGLT